ncbi:glutathione S-transferase family protein [Pseudoalteromonas luteoviolacea]|uniref:glutathione S-transferase family protein n=1 Tax=Pseudoalteromonas luteoviolacea TaxID=43657 RepID=UPI001B38AD30|nr:glutathione S-transferase family protein [Pseudoalteromonas luteoviolacea]MBQ4811314.1 glutathione S-transferase family protein [Pseudoalteromonas luteoviolacea]
MYTLYLIPSACSLAIQVMLRELNQPFTLVDQQNTENFIALNPANKVPALVDNGNVYTEGAAIMLYLLRTHSSEMWPSSLDLQQQIIEDLMFANASMHPAYGRLFFASQAIADEPARQLFLEEAARQINQLWQVVSLRLQQREHKGRFLGGGIPSAADIFLAVYARWGAHFFVDIQIPKNVQQMLDGVMARPSFKAALLAEQSLA